LAKYWNIWLYPDWIIQAPPTPAVFLGSFIPLGWTLGTDEPCGWAKATLERKSKVPRSKSAKGMTTLKFLPM
jgi:hypothetical protein